MKRELSIYGCGILICFMLCGFMSACKYVIVCPETKQAVTVFDSTELKQLRSDYAKARKDIYWVCKQRDQLKIDKHELEGRIGDTNVFKRMYFDNEGNLIKAN